MTPFNLPVCLSVLAIVCVPGIAAAVPIESMYPPAGKDSQPVCYMESANGNTLDLSKLCGFKGNYSNSESNLSNETFNVSETRLSDNDYISSDRSGRCWFPDDLDLNGNRCEGRATRLRPNVDTDSQKYEYVESASEAIARQRRQIEKTFSQQRQKVEEVFNGKSF